MIGQGSWERFLPGEGFYGINRKTICEYIVPKNIKSLRTRAEMKSGARLLPIKESFGPFITDDKVASGCLALSIYLL